ncbi:MAG: tetratricopeptide repeat protein [Cyanobacteriota bacterium]
MPPAGSSRGWRSPLRGQGFRPLLVAAALWTAGLGSGAHAEAARDAARSEGGDSPLALARQLGVPAGVVLFVVVVLALITQADKLEKVWGWLRRLGSSPPPADQRPAAGPPASVTFTDNKPQGSLYQAGRDVNIYPQPDPKLPGGGKLHNLPPAVSGFVARDEQLQALERALRSPGAEVVIHGLPGVGKTALALRYATTRAPLFSGGAWWMAATEGFEAMALRASVELEARIPGLSQGDGLEPEARLRRCWQAWPGDDDAPVLLVVDNVPSGLEGQRIRSGLGTGLPPRFRRLLTQRADPLTADAAIDLPVLGSDEALALLKVRAGEAGSRRIEREMEEARRLVAAVEGLPLALVLLGGRLRRVPALSVAALRRDLARPELGAEAFGQAHADVLAEQGLVATLLASWATLTDEGRELARLLSLTLAAPIPWELIERCEPPDPAFAQGRFWDNALADLVGANLLDQLDREADSYHLHPLVREFFGIQRQGWEAEDGWRGRLAAAARELARRREGVDVIASVDFWRQAGLADPTEASACFGLGYGLIRLGDLTGAGEAFERSRRNAEAAEDQRGIAIALNGIGDVLVLQGDGPGALAAYQAGLRIAEDLAKRDPANTEWQRDLSVSQEKMGDVMKLQQNFPAALASYQASLAIRDNLTSHDPSNALWQVDLAEACLALGSLGSALSDPSRRALLVRGRDILSALRDSNRLQPSDLDTLTQLEEQIRSLDSSR